MTIKSQKWTFRNSTTKLITIKQIVVFRKSEVTVGDSIPVCLVSTGH